MKSKTPPSLVNYKSLKRPINSYRPMPELIAPIGQESGTKIKAADGVIGLIPFNSKSQVLTPAPMRNLSESLKLTITLLGPLNQSRKKVGQLQTLNT